MSQQALLPFPDAEFKQTKGYIIVATIYKERLIHDVDVDADDELLMFHPTKTERRQTEEIVGYVNTMELAKELVPRIHRDIKDKPDYQWTKTHVEYRYVPVIHFEETK